MTSEITQSELVLGGTPVFKGTRVPVKALIEYLEAGDSIDVFLQDFPSVSRQQVVAVLEEAREKLLNRTWHPSRLPSWFYRHPQTATKIFSRLYRRS